jgi:hypothetical protein
MRYCVYRQWQGSGMQEVLEYFVTREEAQRYALRIRTRTNATVHVGEFVSTWVVK